MIGTGYIEPPQDEPWLLGSIPRDVQDYFDEIYAVIEALILVPCPIAEKNPVNRTIEPCTWEVGSVRISANFDGALLISAIRL